MSVNTIVGQLATGDDFFERPHIIQNLWSKLEAGNNVLIAAPRRVGKTSLLYRLKDTPKVGYRFIYLITESVNNENEFFRKLYGHIFDLLNGITKFSQRIKNFIGSKDIQGISKDGIQLGNKTLNYYDAVEKLLEIIDLDGEKLIIMIDEIAETVENISKDENEKNAIRFLQKNRELRHSSVLKDKIRFIYAGSIGLENVVANLNASSTVNDLYSFKLTPFTKEEAESLIYDKILLNSEMNFEKENMEYLFSKIEWLIPFYIHLIIDEVYQIFVSKKLENIENEIIDEAIQNAIEHRSFFDPWISRLRKAYKGDSFNFIKEVMNKASENETLSSAEIFDLSVKHKLEHDYKNLINALIYDGYINNNDDPKIYRFNSPLLKIWWYKYVAN